MKLSVIVPVYNTEQYLPRCIDSILSQSFTDYELLLIDDGSKDGSGAICDTYSKKDGRVCVFHKENGGVSSARNLGLQEAKGEWVTFVDSDDWIEEDYFQIPFEDGSDLYIQNMKYANGNFEEFFECSTITQEESRDFFENNLHSHMFRTVWCFFFRRKTLVDNGIEFDESIKLGEDTLFAMDYYRYTGTIHIIGSSKYVYNQQEDWDNKYTLSWPEAERFLSAFMDRYEALHIKAPKLLAWMFDFVYEKISKEENRLNIKWVLSEPVLRYRRTLLSERGLNYWIKFHLLSCMSWLVRM